MGESAEEKASHGTNVSLRLRPPQQSGVYCTAILASTKRNDILRLGITEYLSFADSSLLALVQFLSLTYIHLLSRTQSD